MTATPLLALVLTMTGAPPAAAATERDLVFLADERPVFLRLRLAAGARAFDAAWPDSVQTLFETLDRDHDGRLSAREAEPGLLDALVRLATGEAVPQRGETAVVEGQAAAATNNKDRDKSQEQEGIASPEALGERLRARPGLGPFRIDLGRQAEGRTDALFDHLDRDKDGQVTRAELGVIAGSLRRLDLDDDEMINPGELEPFRSPTAAAITEPGLPRPRPRVMVVPAVVETTPGESPLRLARLLLRKYDTGRDGTPGRPDGKLSEAEFAVDPDTFSQADRNQDGLLDSDDLRRLLGGVRPDVVLDVNAPVAAAASGRLTVEAKPSENPANRGVKARVLSDGGVELVLGRVRLDVLIDDSQAAARNAQRGASRRFRAFDANNDGYLDGKELTAANTAPSPLAGLTSLIDRDGDGKLSARELDTFVQRQLDAARGRLVLSVSDQGRALFGVLDLDGDRRLSARELSRAGQRVASWDANGDGRIEADEIPYHILVTLSQGDLKGLTRDVPATAGPQGAGTSATLAARPGAGPDWFQRMDRNHDGDVSRREFLGPRAQFDRIDRDRDGLIDPTEAAAITGPR